MANLRTELVEAHRADNFLEAVYKCSLSDGDRRDEVASELAALHNEGVVDVVHAFEQLKNDAVARADFFLTRHVFEKALVQISAPVPSVMRTVLHLLREAGQDLAAGTVIESYVRFCARSHTRPYEALEQIEREPEPFAALLPATVSAGCSVDPTHFMAETVRLCGSTHIDLRRQAVFSLGRCHSQQGENSSETLLLTIERVVLANDDDHVLAAAITASFSVFQQNRTQENRVATIIVDALQKGGQFAVHAASEVFGFHSEELPPLLLEKVIPRLQNTPPGNGGTLRNIDFGISRLLKTTSAARVISLLEELLLAHPDKLTIDSFPSAMEVIRNDRPLLSKIATRWLFNGARAICNAVVTIVERSAEEITELEADPTELPADRPLAVLFVARKAVGYLFFNPICAAYFVISSMRLTNHAGVLDNLSQLLFDPLLLNFTGTVREFVGKQLSIASDDVKPGLEKAIGLIDGYLGTLRSVENIPALQPSEAQREAYYRHFSQQVSRSFREALNKSVFLKLVSRSVVLHGTKSIQYVYGSDGIPKRMDMEFKSHGTEMEMPRLEQIDPFGAEYVLRVLRAEQRKK